jgi:hypothetical protein
MIHYNLADYNYRDYLHDYGYNLTFAINHAKKTIEPLVGKFDEKKFRTLFLNGMRIRDIVKTMLSGLNLNGLTAGAKRSLRIIFDGGK